MEFPFKEPFNFLYYTSKSWLAAIVAATKLGFVFPIDTWTAWMTRNHKHIHLPWPPEHMDVSGFGHVHIELCVRAFQPFCLVPFFLKMGDV